MKSEVMNCGGCEKPLLSSEIMICKKCVIEADKINEEEKLKTGEYPFGGPENFNMLLDKFVITIAEYQATHRIDFGSTMAILEVFKGCVENADKNLLILYGKTLGENGVDVNGNDLT